MLCQAGQPRRLQNSFVIAWRCCQAHTEQGTMRLPLAIATAALATFALSAPAFAGSAEDVIEKEKCHKCHTEKTTKKAPSWASIAEKYKGKADVPERLFKQLKAGGKFGDEEDHKKVTASDEDIKAIVQIVLSSK
jgi:cytochrome c551/c552